MNRETGKLLVTSQEAALDIIGFKTIRFFKTRKEEKAGDGFRERVWSLQHNFPCARILVNINSNVEEQVSSIQTAFGSGKNSYRVRKDIETANQHLKQLAQELGSQRALLLDKDQWTRDINVLNEAVSWMGFPTPECHFPELLEFNTNKYQNGKTQLSLNPNCTGLR